jgi:hypothetical protein
MVGVVYITRSKNGDSVIGPSTEYKSDRVKVYNNYTGSFEMLRLSLANKIALALRGYSKFEKRQYEGWTGESDFYVYKCKIDGKKQLMLDYPHGFSSELECTLCK